MAQVWSASLGLLSARRCPPSRSDASYRRHPFRNRYPRLRRQPLLWLIILCSICIGSGQYQHYHRALQHMEPAVGPLSQQRMISSIPSNVKIAQLSRHQESSPPLAAQVPAFWSVSQGPGVDLVALNWRRFELEHKHHNQHETTGEDLRRGELIESQVAAIPDQILSRLPDEVNRQIIESLSADPSLILAPRADPKSSTAAEAAAATGNGHSEDPDGASIERLTKSCLAIQASSLTPDQLNVSFHLYTRRNPVQSYLVHPQADRNELLTGSPFDPRRPIKWITHGFHTNVDKSEWMLEAKDKILAHEDANVFLTDWRRGASPALAFYPKAAANAHVVARMIVKILRRLRSDINLAQVHLIGHSLGAHIMGFVGSAFSEEFLHKQQQILALKSARDGAAQSFNQPPPPLTASSVENQMIGRITACDPALPCFGPSSQAPNSKTSGVLATGHMRGAKFKQAPSRVGKFGINRAEFRRQTAQGQQAEEASGDLLSGLLSGDDWTPAMWTHLRPDSAILVEVMHSNPGVMGYSEPLGDYDFYPNGSERQPGCSGGDGGSRGRSGSTEALPVTRSTSRQLDGQTLRHQSARQRGNMISKRQLGLVGSVMQTVANHNQQQISLATGETSRGSGTGMSDLGKSLSEFMRPIRDFFHTYTCSHHRSVEYMVESMYYEKIEPSKRLNPEHVCQLVGYRCADYQTFKRGHCYLCRDEFECRSLGMFNGMPSSASADNPEPFRNLAKRPEPNFAPENLDVGSMNEHKQTGLIAMQAQMEGPLRHKRILPTLNQYRQNYKATQRNQYYFDTRPTRNFCLHHYHLLIRYRWLRVRKSLTIDRLRLGGTVNDLLVHHPMTFHKFEAHSYTMLLTHADFLGQIETLMLYGLSGNGLKSRYIEHIDITYMSNIDPFVRGTNSARMCLANPSGEQRERLKAEMSHLIDISDHAPGQPWSTEINLFVRCPPDNLFVR